MYKIVFILVFLGVTCNADFTGNDWKNYGFYRPRRNYPQSQTQNSYSHNTQPFQYSQNFQSKTSASSNSQNQNLQDDAFDTQKVQNAFGAGFNSFQPENTFKTEYNQANFNTFLSQKPQNPDFAFSSDSQSQNVFGSSFGQINSLKKQFGNYNQQVQTKSLFGTDSGQNQRQPGSRFGQNGVLYQNLATSSFRQGTFKGPEYLPPHVPTRPPYTAPTYLPPRETPKTTTNRPFFTSTRRPYTNTYRPFYTTTKPVQTTTRRRYFNVTTQRTTTRKPFYITTAKIHRIDLSPAMAMPVPPEPEDDSITTTTTTTTTSPITTTTTIPTTTTVSSPDPNRFLEDTLPTTATTLTTTTTFTPSTTTFKAPEYLPPEVGKENPRPPLAPAMAMPVPPEPEDDPTPSPTTPITTTTTTTPAPTTLTKATTNTPSTTTFKAPEYLPPEVGKENPRPPLAPAMAMPVPPEPEDDPTPSPTTPITTTTTTTPAPTTLTKTTTNTPSTTTFKAPEYLPPEVGKENPRPPLAPAMAMPVPPEPEDDPTPSPTTPITTTTTTTPAPTTLTKTTTNTPSTTTFKAPEYLPPEVGKGFPQFYTDRPVIGGAAMAMSVPPEPEDDLTPSPTTPTKTTTTPSTTTTTTTTTTPSTTTFRAPELPPKEIQSIPPKPAMAMPVPPECDPSDPTTYPSDIEEGSSDPCGMQTTRKPPTSRPPPEPEDDPTTPNQDRFLIEEIMTTPPPFKGPQYLPPESNNSRNIEIPTCLPTLKRVVRSAKTLRLGDVKGARPVWHVGVYIKTTVPYMQICGGSVVRQDVVISAAHCFWSDLGPDSAENYAVGANKVYKPYGEPMDKRAQKSDVKEIILPPRYRGGVTSFQDDLAVLRLASPFTYARGLRPICVDFNDDFNEQQLSEGNSGTIAGWGYTDSEGSRTQWLLWLELPYVAIETCIERSEGFVKYITSDKICAGEFNTGKALCKGDSGGGLVFWHGEPDNAVPYLRGIASTAPSADNLKCNVLAAGSFTHINAHRRFLRKHVPGIDENCRYKE